MRIVFPLVVFPLVSRILLPEGIGRVNYANAVANYFVLFSTLGIPLYGLREIAKAKGNKTKRMKTFASVFSVNLILVMLSYLLLFAGITTGLIEKESKLIIIHSLLIVFTLFEAEWYFQGTENYRFITYRNLIVKSLSILLIFVFVKTKADFIWYAVILVFGIGGNSILNFSSILKEFGFKLFYLFKPTEIKNAINVHFSKVLTTSALALAGSIYLNLDLFMIGYFSGNNHVGYYTASSRIIRVVISVVLALNTVLLPKATDLIKNNEMEKLRQVVGLTNSFIYLISIPAIILLLFYAEPIILMFAGEDYIFSADILRILTFIIFFVSMNNLLGLQVLYPSNEEKKFLKAILIGAGINLIFNLALIPQLKSIGAAYASVFAELVIFIMLFFYTRKIIMTNQWHIFKPYLLATGLMLLSIVLLNKVELYNGSYFYIFEILFASAIYLLVLFFQKNQFLRNGIKLKNEIR